MRYPIWEHDPSVNHIGKRILATNGKYAQMSTILDAFVSEELDSFQSRNEQSSKGLK